MKLIECFSNVEGRNTAFKIAKELNSMKSDDSKLFSVWSLGDNQYRIMGEVCKKDWKALDLQSDFMRL